MTETATVSHYSKADLIAALRVAGIGAGATVFSHSNIGFFGVPDEGNDRKIAARIILEAFQDVLGPCGTLAVPTFTYSFCKGEVFDPASTSSTCGYWSEFIRTQPRTCRSHDPIFSVAALGCLAHKLTKDVSLECFGIDSFWDRFLNANGVVCNLNVWVISTFIHYVEKRLGRTYRYDKQFGGKISKSGVLTDSVATFYCHDLSKPATCVETEIFDELAFQSGLAKKVEVGRGYITAMAASDIVSLVEQTIESRPYFLIQAGKSGQPPLCQSDNTRSTVQLDERSSMLEIIQKLGPLNRNIVSDGFDVALNSLATILPMEIIEYPTGTHCFDLIMPEKWHCVEAHLTSLSGEKVIDLQASPLHVMSYSMPFEGLVKGEELLEHIYTSDLRADAVPFVQSPLYRQWAFCAGQCVKNRLIDTKYQVLIDAHTEFGSLKVGDAVLPGKMREEFVLCVHLDHPCQVIDGVSGVAVAMEVMRRIRTGCALQHGVRLLIVPEKYGTSAWLSSHLDLLTKIKAVLCLDALALSEPYVLQLSQSYNSPRDLVAADIVRSIDPFSQIGKFPNVHNDDWHQFNRPGLSLTALALMRSLQWRYEKSCPYPEHHSHLDTESLVSLNSLESSVFTVLEILKAWDELD